ncbi:hypothetical protein Rsub_02021 [Raphidocelis subcapitata]|uniref:Protein phosphatase 1 regulatory subunit 7 n=1 Tax=Raphidocelis subcapitata TaxID=307507 RepID=A0A2V0NQ94_9CHLO|nr:hypothetical protein Rsub_02021 [Raphidocelis subcapitata]|eukprot:GBF89449.1 hypothetical protein Rsub_02021 [Raphidocelis subcapitata]
MAQLGPLTEEEREAFEAIAESNGLETSELAERGTAHIKELELFLGSMPKMLALNLFPALKTLRLIDQGISEVRGLDACTALERLWLCENRITSLAGLSHLGRLRELYVYSNRLTATTGLEALTSLEVLSLANNFITRIEGLSGLPRLRDLCLASNEIPAAAAPLAGCGALTALNLAANRVATFQELHAIAAALPRLRDLCLHDPLWGGCPLSALPNYATAALAALPGLTALDTLLVSPEARAAAAATLDKKRLYYSMRGRTLRRRAGDLADGAARGLALVRARCDAAQRALRQRAAELRRALEEAEGDAQGGSAEARREGRACLEELDRCVATARARRGAAAAALEAARRESARAVAAAARRLDVELESCGNVRLEAGHPGDAWVDSLAEVLRGRLGAGARCLGVAGLRVIEALRLHNRGLRAAFEAAGGVAGGGGCSGGGGGDGCSGAEGAEGGVEAAAPLAEARAEYLFAGEDPGQPLGLTAAAQAGLQPRHCGEVGVDAAVPLHSSVLGADGERLRACLRQKRHGGSGTDAGGPDGCCVGRLLVCRAQLGGGVQRAAASAAGGGAAAPMQWRFPGASALCVAESGDWQQQPEASGDRAYYLQDLAAALPEFLVTFEYEAAPGSQLAPMRVPAAAAAATAAAARGDPGFVSGPEALQAAAAGSEPWLRAAAAPLLPWLALVAADAGGRGPEGVQPSAAWLAEEGAAANALERSAAALAALGGGGGTAAGQAAAPAAPLPAARLLERLRGAAARGGGAITRLDLSGCGLRCCDVAPLRALLNLRELVLSFNELASFSPLEPLAASLRRLDVSHNAIASLCGGAGACLLAFRALAALDVGFNRLGSLEDLIAIAGCLPQLEELCVEGNAAADAAAAAPLLLHQLGRLRLLDGAPADRAGGLAGAVMAAAEVYECVSEWREEERGGDGPAPGVPAAPAPHAPASAAPDWRDRAAALDASGRALLQLPPLAGFACLQRADLSGNRLLSVEGLQACTALTELDLSGNSLLQADPLSSLTRLLRLDVSCNRLATLAPLRPLARLEALAAERNRLATLDGVQGLSALVELYAASNAVAGFGAEARRLAALPRLAVVDLAGNPLASECEDYRLQLVYALRRSRVIDGEPVTPGELAAARGRYSGRLTLEFLEEQLGGPSVLPSIRALDLSGLRIRDTSAAFAPPGTPFCGLTELVLDDNALPPPALAALAGLTALCVLRLNGNRLGERGGGGGGGGEGGGGAAAAAQLAAAPPSAQPAAAVDEGAGAAGEGGGRGGGGAPQADDWQLPSVSDLQLRSNGLSSLAPLQLSRRMPALRRLDVAGNELSRLEGLEGLPRLRELMVSRNRLRSLDGEALAPLTRLRELHAEDCGLRSLAGLSRLPALTLLVARGNRLGDAAAEAERVAGLGELREVALAGNPLARRPVYRQLLIFRAPQLRAIDGERVTDDDRAAAQLLLAAPAAPQPGGGGAGGAALYGPLQLPQGLRDILAAGGGDAVTTVAAATAAAAAAAGAWPPAFGGKGGDALLQQQLAALALGAAAAPAIQAGGGCSPFGGGALALEGVSIGGAAAGAAAGGGAPARPGSASGRRAGGIGAIRLTCGPAPGLAGAAGGALSPSGGGGGSPGGGPRRVTGGAGSFRRSGRG